MLLRLIGLAMAVCLALPARPVLAQAIIVESSIRVQVGGLVRRPGLYRMYQGSRVADAIQAAGGLRQGADLSALNLASALSDGETLIVPPHEAVPSPAPSQGTAARRNTRRAAARKPSKSPHPVFINTASADQLCTLPGIGGAIASDILSYRHQHGGHFRSIDELREVPGIGERRLDRLRPFLRL